MTRIFRFSTLIVSFLALLCAIPAQGRIIMQGYIHSDTVWTAADTIEIPDRVTVDSGAVLTITSGTVVLFRSGADLLAMGSLQALGEAEAPIIFSSAVDTAGGTPAPTDWSGLVLYGASDCLLRHCEIRYCFDALYVRNSSATLESCTLRDFYLRGLYVSTSDGTAGMLTTINHCTIKQTLDISEGKATGIYLYQCGTLEAQHSRILDCEYGLQAYGFQTFQPRFELDNCQIEGHSLDGIYAYSKG